MADIKIVVTMNTGEDRVFGGANIWKTDGKWLVLGYKTAGWWLKNTREWCPPPAYSEKTRIKWSLVENAHATEFKTIKHEITKGKAPVEWEEVRDGKSA